MSDLRVGVIGFGLRSGLVAAAHRPGEGSRIVAVCDPRPERRRLAREAYGDELTAVATVEELLAGELDAVFVLSPDHLHEAHAVSALQAGAAVYVEKPMAITTAGADRMLATAQQTGSRLYVGHNMRHMPVVVQMRQLIQDGAIGDVRAIWCRHFVGHGGDFYFKDWHSERARTTGLLLQKGAHDIDVIHWLADGYTERVSAVGGLTVYGDVGQRADGDGYLQTYADTDNLAWPPAAQRGLNPALDVEDLSMVLMTLGNGVFASYQQCHFTPDYSRSYTVIGDAGRLENFGDGTGDEIRVWNTRALGYAETPDEVVTIGAGAGGGHGGADDGIVAEFLRYARDGGDTVTSPIAAREAVATGFAATESLRDGGRLVEIPAATHPAAAGA